MANGLNKGRYLLPLLNLIESRLTSIKGFIDNGAGDFNANYYVGAELLDLQQATNKVRRLVLTYDEKRLLQDFDERIETMYKVIRMKLDDIDS